jgi:hypothetical protein
MTEFRPGERVQTHPATDDWMRGDRYGTVIAVGRRYVAVRLDRSGRLRRFLPADLLPT